MAMVRAAARMAEAELARDAADPRRPPMRPTRTGLHVVHRVPRPAESLLTIMTARPGTPLRLTPAAQRDPAAARLGPARALRRRARRAALRGRRRLLHAARGAQPAARLLGEELLASRPYRLAAGGRRGLAGGRGAAGGGRRARRHACLPRPAPAAVDGARRRTAARRAARARCAHAMLRSRRARPDVDLDTRRRGAPTTTRCGWPSAPPSGDGSPMLPAGRRADRPPGPRTACLTRSWRHVERSQRRRATCPLLAWWSTVDHHSVTPLEPHMTVYAPPGTADSHIRSRAATATTSAASGSTPIKGGYFENISPVNGKPFTEVGRGTAEDIEAAIDAAHAAADAWGRTSADRALEHPAQDRRPRSRRTSRCSRSSRPGTTASRSARRSPRTCRSAIDHFRYFAGCPARPGGQRQRDRRGHDRLPLPRAARRRRPDHPVELPDPDGRLEARSRAGRRQRRRAQARRADPVVDPQADGAHRRPAAGRRAERRQRLRRRGRQAARQQQPDRARSRSPARPRPAG